MFSWFFLSFFTLFPSGKLYLEEKKIEGIFITKLIARFFSEMFCKNVPKIPQEMKASMITVCLQQTMTEAEHNLPNPKFFDNWPSASAAELFGEMIRPIISLKNSAIGSRFLPL